MLLTQVSEAIQRHWLRPTASVQSWQQVCKHEDYCRCAPAAGYTQTLFVGQAHRVPGTKCQHPRHRWDRAVHLGSPLDSMGIVLKMVMHIWHSGSKGPGDMTVRQDFVQPYCHGWSISCCHPWASLGVVLDVGVQVREEGIAPRLNHSHSQPLQACALIFTVPCAHAVAQPSLMESILLIASFANTPPG